MKHSKSSEFDGGNRRGGGKPHTKRRWMKNERQCGTKRERTFLVYVIRKFNRGQRLDTIVCPHPGTSSKSCFSPPHFSYGVELPSARVDVRFFSPMADRFAPHVLRQLGLMQHGTYAFDKLAVERHSHAIMLRRVGCGETSLRPLLPLAE